MHAAGCTGVSIDLSVTSASRKIENSNLPTLCCRLALLVFEPLFRAFAATLGNAVKFWVSYHFLWPSPELVPLPVSENGRTSRAVKLFSLFLFRDHCQSAKASGTFCSPCRRYILRTFARVTQCCRFEAFAHKGGWVSWSLVGASRALRGVNRLFRRHRLPDVLPFSDWAGLQGNGEYCSV